MELKFNPETGLYEANNEDSWQVGYKPPPPPPAPEPTPAQIWGVRDIGQGKRYGDTLDMSKIHDANYYKQNQQEIEDRLHREAGSDNPRKNY